MKNGMISWKVLNKKQLAAVGSVGIFLAVIIAALLIRAASGSASEVSYRETQVKYGNLAVGVTEDGAVDIGTVEQTFDLDMSALQRASTEENTESSGTRNTLGGSGMASPDRVSGGLDMFQQIFGMANSGVSQSGEAPSLMVSEVCISIGQQVSVGDVLYRLEDESVLELTEKLQSDVEKAQADLEAVYADQELSRQKAQYTYDSSIAYASYAETEYNTSVASLQQAVTDGEKQLEQAQNSLSDYRQQLEETTELWEEAKERLAECEWGADHCDKWESTYGYVTAFQLVQTTQSTVDSLEQKKERLENNVEQAQKNVETAQQTLNAAKRNLEQGLLSAQETYDLRQLAYDTAQETYDIAIAYLEKEAGEQEEICAEARKNWEEYSSYVNGTDICSRYNGVITGIELEKGDSIHTGTVLVTLYDTDEVSMTVTVAEEDMTDICQGSEAVINLTAYPDTSFRARVTEIADAEADSFGNVSYEVTVTLEGDVSGLFQGMTGEITFITEETEEVLYVSRRAIVTEGDKSYVKVREEDGKMKKIQVTTGFTDGTHTEIIGNLKEGDTVLIESKVTK